MNRIEKLKEKKAQAVERMRALLDLAESETRDLTEAEDTEYKSLDASLAKIDKDIEREERLAEQEAAMSKPAKSVRLSTKAQKTDPKEFVDLRDFLLSVVSRRDDPRLYDLYEEREQSMGTGTKGGFMVPEQFRPGLLAIDPQAAIFRPRAQVIPAGSPPDAAISMAALNQGAAKNMYGGVTVQWIAEGGTKPETDVDIRQIKLEWSPRKSRLTSSSPTSCFATGRPLRPFVSASFVLPLRRLRKTRSTAATVSAGPSALPPRPPASTTPAPRQTRLHTPTLSACSPA